jgi:hypothetical protein
LRDGVMHALTLDDVIEAAQRHNISIRGIVRSDSGSLVLMEWSEHDSYAMYFSTGWLDGDQQAIGFAYAILQETTEEIMNLLKNDKLFPNIRGVMLKDKPVTLHLSGKVKITELQGGDARVELAFSDHKKTAVVNRNQVLNIIEAYGPETDAWAGKPVVLYAEQGVWFGKRQWGIRVDAEATMKAAKSSMNGKAKPGAAPAQPDLHARQAFDRLDAIETQPEPAADETEEEYQARLLELFETQPEGAYA